MKKWIALLILLIPALAYPQGIRIDNIAIQGGNPLRSIPNANVTICTSAGTGTPCTPLATTYTDVTLATPCPGGAQLVLANTSTCAATADTLGNYGAWVAPGTYILTVTAIGLPPYSTTLTLQSSLSGTPNIIPVGSASYPATAAGINLADSTGLGSSNGSILVTAPGSYCDTTVLLSNGHTLNFGAGTYQVNIAGADSSVANVTWAVEGLGANQTILQACPASGKDVITDQNFGTLTGSSNLFGVYYPVIKGMTIDGNGTAPYGIRTYGQMIAYPDVTVQNTTTGSIWAEQNGRYAPNNNNFNSVYWAGPGATPTIDQAVTACGAHPCTIMISSFYTGAASASLFTTSTGYSVYTGANNVTVVDLRANATFGTQPNYSLLYGGRIAGNLMRLGCNYWSNSPADSTSCGVFFNWISGTLPAADQFGVTGVIWSHDSVTVGGSTYGLGGGDFECNADATSSDSPLPYCYGLTAGGHIVRTNTTQPVAELGAAHLFGCGNASTSGATIGNCYVAKLEAPGPVTGEAFSLYSKGDIVFDQNVQIWARSSGTPARSMKFPGTTVMFNLSLIPTTPGLVNVGLPTFPFSQIVLGNVANQSVAFNPLTLAGNRTVNIADPGVATVSLTLLGSVGAAGIQTKRTSGCATAASLAAVCSTTVTWTTSFADTNYTVACVGDLVTSGVPLHGGLTAKANASVIFQTVSATAAAAQYTTIDCTAVHD